MMDKTEEEKLGKAHGWRLTGSELDSALITTVAETAVKCRTTVGNIVSKPPWSDMKGRRMQEQELEQVHQLEQEAGEEVHQMEEEGPCNSFLTASFLNFPRNHASSDCEHFHCTLQHTFISLKSPPSYTIPSALIPSKELPAASNFLKIMTCDVSCQRFSSPVLSSYAMPNVATCNDTVSI